MSSHRVPESKFLEVAFLVGVTAFVMTPRAPGERLGDALAVIGLVVLAAGVAAVTATWARRRHRAMLAADERRRLARRNCSPGLVAHADPPGRDHPTERVAVEVRHGRPRTGADQSMRAMTRPGR